VLYHQQLAFILILVLGAASITEYLGVHAVFGAFIFGMCMPTSQVLRSEINLRFEPLVVSFLMPLYFVNSGLKTDLTKVLFNDNLLFPLLTIIIISFVSKYGFCTLAIRRLGYCW
ncbi:cation:proton antiporter domain-containing protein, partial [Aneurinibacillus tyrosinisolvens]|uniref:cation:proton antiporter domain-containing protein n=1 Tax=Aneurinibacillus tyrosinisolvens TaxID=1443435 RepID=UPI000A63C8DD